MTRVKPVDKLEYGGRKLPMMANTAIYYQISRCRLQTLTCRGRVPERFRV